MDLQEKERVAFWRLLLLSASGGAVDLGYAVEEGYALPIIRSMGVSLTLATVALAVSPIVGLIAQPFLGALSDNCFCSWGRRKPFILLLSLMSIAGCGAPYVTYLGVNNVLVIIVVGLIALFDFSIGQLQLPTRAFLLDLVPVSQSQFGNSIFSMVLVAYATLGFLLGAVDWSSVFGKGFKINEQSQVVFGLTAVFILLSMILTLFSNKEKHNRITNYTNPIYTAAHKIDLQSQQREVQSQRNIIHIEKELKPDVASNEKQPLLKQTDTETAQTNTDYENSSKSEEYQKKSSPKCCNIAGVFTNALVDVVSFIYYMSFEMWLVWLVTLLGFFGEFAYVYGFTTFVGTVIYEGEPEATDQTSDEYTLYLKGVRMGSLSLALSSIVGGVMSLCLDRVTKWISLKTVFLFVMACFVLSNFLMILLQEIYFTMLFGLCYGPFLVTLLVVPYALIPIYEVYCTFNYA